jgi:hypothetical protein
MTVSIDSQRNSTAQGIAVAVKVIIFTFYGLGVIAFIAGLVEAITGQSGFTSTSVSVGDASIQTNTPAFALMLIGVIAAVGPTGLFVQLLGAGVFFAGSFLMKLLGALFQLFGRGR